ncbi:hypothetical protein F5887DRAFT_1065217 [Amanita rubescens]|nr:hypothetical protein F5887DRAFT_1065217 [Amanita rubescens]
MTSTTVTTRLREEVESIQSITCASLLCPYCDHGFESQRGRTTHIRAKHPQLGSSSSDPTNGLRNDLPDDYLGAPPPDGYEDPPSPTQPRDEDPPSPTQPRDDVPSPPGLSVPLDALSAVQQRRHVIDPWRRGMRKQYHPHLTAQCTDADGNILLANTPPPPRHTLAPDDCTPFERPTQFLLANFLFKREEMSAPNINYLLDLWDADMKRHGNVYDTIDAIQDGIAPWRCYAISLNPGGSLDVDDRPSWMNQKYEVWCRDPDTVIRNILDNPDFAAHFDTVPYIARDRDAKRRWTDFMSGQFAWQRSTMIHNDDPATKGAMYCSVILGSDKTTVSVATGNVEYHPLYLSIGNIHNVARRGHRNGVIPIGFLAIPKSERKYDNNLEYRTFRRQLYHTSISAILMPLHHGMTTPVVRRCPDGHYRRVIYDLGPYIADYPEQVMLSGIVSGWCPKCMAMPKELEVAHEGDRWTQGFMNDLVNMGLDSEELWDAFGMDDDIITKPFTNDFPRADIHESLSPDLLHQIIKGSFKDHLVTWICDYILHVHGDARGNEILDEIDRRIAMTPPFPGLRRFPHGRRFKQWTGDDSKALMKVYLPAIAEYVPPELTQCLAAFLNFCYIVRRPEIGEAGLVDIQNELTKYHTLREVFRKSGIRPDGFNLPRQHAMVHYIRMIRMFGAPTGLCSSITESRHITAVKKPWRRSNRYEALGQMLMTIQRLDKLTFAWVNFVNRGIIPPQFTSSVEQSGDAVDVINYNNIVQMLISIYPAARSYPSELSTLARYISQPQLPLLLQQFLFDQLYPDAPPAYEVPENRLPVIDSDVLVYHSARALFHSPGDISGTHGMRSQTIRSSPKWRGGHERRDCVLIVEEEDRPGMKGMMVGRVQCFLSFSHLDNHYHCALIDHFKRVGARPDPVTGLWKVPIQSVIHIDTILRNVHLIPVFGDGNVPQGLHYHHSFDVFDTFYVNKYADHHSFEIIT